MRDGLKKANRAILDTKTIIKVDKTSKFIKKCFVSSASMHDSQALEFLLNESDMGQTLCADSAYVGQQEIMEKWQLKDVI